MIEEPDLYQLNVSSMQKIYLILNTDYPEQIDDMEYLIDMINYYIKKMFFTISVIIVLLT